MTKIDLQTEYIDTQMINVIFNQGKTIGIDTKGDVDFTELIKELTLMIKEDVELVFQKFESEDPKLLLIQDTLGEIIKSFNQSIKATEENVDADDTLF